MIPSAPQSGSAENVITVRGVTKIFKDFWNRPKARAVDNVDFDVRRGEVFGLLGPNGSGKSTTVKLMLGLLYPTKGHIEVFGHSPRHVATKSRIGYLPEESYLYRYLNSRETLDFFGNLFHLNKGERDNRAEQLLEMVGLSQTRTRAVGEFSKGMQRRIGLAQALINDPDLVILDEPTSGLDPLMIEAFSETIDELARSGRTTVFLSSHILSGVDRICQRIGLVRGGQLVAVRTLSEMRATAPRRLTVTFSTPVNGDLPMLPGATLVTREPMQWILDVQGPLGEIIPRLGHLPVADVQLAAFTLDDTILHLLGHVHKDRHAQKDRHVQKDVPYKDAGAP